MCAFESSYYVTYFKNRYLRLFPAHPTGIYRLDHAPEENFGSCNIYAQNSNISAGTLKPICSRGNFATLRPNLLTFVIPAHYPSSSCPGQYTPALLHVKPYLGATPF